MKIVKFNNDITLNVVNMTTLQSYPVEFGKNKKYNARSVYETGHGHFTIVFDTNEMATGIFKVEVFKVYEVKSAKDFYSDLARKLNAHRNCIKMGNVEWETKHFDSILEMVENYLPSGSGFDSGTKFLFEESNDNKLVFQADFHHMDDNGYYDGWSEHSVIIRPDLGMGIDIKITGRNRNEIKDYIRSSFADFDYLVEITQF